MDFNRVYSEYIKPALEEGEFEVFRADEDTRACSILGTCFKSCHSPTSSWLIFTLTIQTVWFELGVRHALRARGVILVQCKRGYQLFDIYPDRKLRYHIKSHWCLVLKLDRRFY